MTTPVGSDEPPVTPKPAVRPIRSGRHDLPEASGRRLWLVSLFALGVVYGDIGTSPLYAINECFFGEHAVSAAVPANVLGLLSLVTWSLILAISIKYLGFILRADHRGEGGVLALGALAMAQVAERWRAAIGVVALLGAAFLYSDGMLTPAISVLSAVEGLELAAPSLAAAVVPITVAIIVLLFLIQSRGTARIGVLFGPIMVVYFVAIAALGAAGIARVPGVLAAFDPRYGVEFFVANGRIGFFALGAVFLVITGGEALYADLGHFGRRPIRVAWFALVLPALLLNYYGQGALLLGDPTLEKPYYRLAPEVLRLPLVVLSAMAAIIASQAVISATFSLTAQAMQLGYCPRMQVRHTSDETIGQIYMPMINWLLMLTCIALVLGFGSSSSLAGAYGVAIATTMVVTTFLLFFVAWRQWRWPLPVALAVVAAFGAIDAAFFAANVVKIPHGGWFPIVTTAAVYAVMTTWHAGRRHLAARLRQTALPMTVFLTDVRARAPRRVPGTAVFLSGNAAATPGALLHNLKHNHVVHERVLLVTVRTEPVATVAGDDRGRVIDLGQGFLGVELHFGYKEDPNIPAALASIREPDLALRTLETSYFLGRETLILAGTSGMARWRRRLFAWLSRNALNATAFFSLPPNRVVELGMHVEI